MKEGIHPDYHEITIVMTDGSSYQTRSTYGKEGDTLRLEIDPKSHPAWTGGQQRLLDTGGQLARFNRRFGGVGPRREATGTASLYAGAAARPRTPYNLLPSPRATSRGTAAASVDWPFTGWHSIDTSASNGLEVCVSYLHLDVVRSPSAGSHGEEKAPGPDMPRGGRELQAHVAHWRIWLWKALIFRRCSAPRSASIAW